MANGAPITEYHIRPVVLIILDGFGVAPPGPGNAISLASMPQWRKFLNSYPSFLLQASGEAVGLPRGEMGNSEVGHLNIGAGRIAYTDLPRINHAISTGVFFKNSVLIDAFTRAARMNRPVHLIGLVSDGGVHSSLTHLTALIECAARNGARVAVHAILDGRDTPYNSSQGYIASLDDVLAKTGAGHIATISGRYWAMDRDRHWERTGKAYAMLVTSTERRQESVSAVEVIGQYYRERIFDEEIPPTRIDAHLVQPAAVQDHDSVVFFNFRADRARQLTQMFIDPSFVEAPREKLLSDLFFVSMTRYDTSLLTRIAFPPEDIPQPLARVISEAGLRQLHIAETEKYAHVTYFIDGGTEAGFPGEEKILVPSPRVSSYATIPEMSAREVTKHIVSAIEMGSFDFIVVNLANPDMVGHTGDLKATVEGLEVIDGCLGAMVDAVLARNGALVITADHGNAEVMLHASSGQIHKEHTTSSVPCVVIGQPWELPSSVSITSDLSLGTPSGILADVAPTILKMMGLEKPPQMTGRPLV